MLYLCLILGVLAGAVLFGFEGLIPGVVMGYLVYQGHTLRKTVGALEKQIVHLEGKIRRLGKTTSRVPRKATDAAKPAVLPSNPPTVEEDTEALVEDVQRSEPPSYEPDLEKAAEIAAPVPEIPPFEPKSEPFEAPPAFKHKERQEVERIVDSLRAFFTSGNWLLRIGVAILFIGLSFLVRLAIENDLFPLELRLLLVGLVGVAMIGIGWRLVGKRREYGLVMEGAGLAVLYLTVFASFRLYELLPESIAAISLVVITIFGVSLGIIQNAQWVSVVSMLGGFFAPVLIATESGSHVALFSYYAILNLGILCTAWFKGWRYLNLTGFLCTLGIGTVWGGLHYDPDLFASTQPFLILFFLIYLCIAVLYAVKHRLSVKHPVDGTLVFGLPVVVFTLQESLVEFIDYGLAISTVIMGLCYLGLSAWLRSKADQPNRNLIESFDGIGITLVSLVIPFSVNATWTGIGWAFEGAALVWLGIRQHRLLVRSGGYLLVIAAALCLMYGNTEMLFETVDPGMPVLNARFMGFLSVSLSLLFVAYQIMKHKQDLFSIEFVVEMTALVAGVAFWLAGGFYEIGSNLGDPWDGHVSTMFSGLTACLIALIGRRLGWVAFMRTILFNIPALYVLVFFPNFLGHPFEDWGILFWGIALVASYVALYVHEGAFTPTQHGLIHAFYLWLITLIGIIEFGELMRSLFDTNTVWELAGALVSLVLIVALVLEATKRVKWPFLTHKKAFLKTSLIPVFCLFALISLAGSFSNAGNSAPLPYIPFLNPLDAILLLGVFLGYRWYARLEKEGYVPDNPTLKRTVSWSMVGLMFIWLNATIARTVHHWGGIPYAAEIWESSVFQSALTICWTLLAVTTMAIVARRGFRTTWMVAAVLLAVVIVKLFAIDLSSLSTVPRIISFIAVGVLLLIIGYIAPAPPRTKEVD